MEKIYWTFKWFKDKQMSEIVFMPFRVDNDYLCIWQTNKGEMASDWFDDSYVKNSFIKVKPSSSDMRNQIRYAFEVKDYFEGVE